MHKNHNQLSPSQTLVYNQSRCHSYHAPMTFSFDFGENDLGFLSYGLVITGEDIVHFGLLSSLSIDLIRKSWKEMLELLIIALDVEGYAGVCCCFVDSIWPKASISVVVDQDSSRKQSISWRLACNYWCLLCTSILANGKTNLQSMECLPKSLTTLGGEGLICAVDKCMLMRVDDVLWV